MRLIVSVISIVFTATVYGATTAGTLSGVVVDGNGTPIAGASVLYRTVPDFTQTSNGKPIPSGPLLASGVRTAADGTFTVTSLPPANYQLCAYGVNNTDLGSCEWGAGTTQVAVAAGQTAQLRFQVSQGTLLTFQVQDPAQQIKSLEDLPTVAGRLPLTGANFGIGIWAGSRYVRAALVSKTATTRQYQVAIPKTATVSLYLDTSLPVIDANAVPIPLRQLATTIAPAGQSALTINLSVP